MQRFGEPVGDRRVIGGGARVSLGGERLAQLERDHAAVLRQFVQHLCIVGGLDHHGDIAMVLSGRADHRRSADVDVLDAVVVSRTLRDGGLERIEVHHEEIDRLDAVLVHGAGVFRVAANSEKPAMHLRVQRLHAAVHHLRKAGQLRHVDDAEPCVLQRLGGAAGRDELDVVAGERRGEVDEPGLVGHRQQGAGNAAGMGDHGQSRLC
jgi:hypothetical protein